MIDYHYDFKFGWRWLLPIQGCRTISLHGFDEDEYQFWRTAFPASEIFQKDAIVDAHVIDAGRYKHRVLGSDADNKYSHASTVCVVGSGSDVAPWRAVLEASFPTFREYGMLPAGNPRVVVPFSSRQNTMVALGLHRPGRWIARLGVWGARILAWMGNNAMLRGRILLVATRNSDTTPCGAEQSRVAAYLPELGLDYALYLGTMDENRKTVVLPLGGVEPATILKIATLPRARRSLNNEAAALEALRESPIAGDVPNLRGVEDNPAALTLYQEFRPRLRVGRRVMDASVVDFLARLSIIDRRSRSLSIILDEMASSGIESQLAAGPPRLKVVWTRLKSLAESGAMVWEHRAHGDFAPWNCAWTRHGLFVFDWEESSQYALAFSDAFYFVTAPALYVEREPHAQKTLDTALYLAERATQAGGFSDIDMRIYLACWLMRRIDAAPYFGEMLSALEQRWR